mmetsp:Transcript_31942/g.42297  ORF Transcript_31942/g.42297 Transcript_31942/m.42297 type:complete len:330 (+) Transcript_31942:145-1134(+)
MWGVARCSVEEGEVVPVVSLVEELGVVEASALVHGVDLGDFLGSEAHITGGHVLAETLRLRRLDERDGLALQVPGEDDLGGGLTLGRGDLRDDGVGQRVQVHKLTGAGLPMAGADRGVGLQVDAPFTVELVALLLLEVGVHLDLVHDGLDARIGEHVSEHGHHAVAHTDRLGQAGVNEGLHLGPDDMVRRVGDLPVLALPVDAGAHPVNEVEVNVLKLELAEGGTAGLLHVLVVRVPQLRRDVELLAGHTSSHHLLEGLSDQLLVAVDHRSVDVAVAVLKNGPLDHLFGVVGHQEGTEADNGDLGTVVEGEAGALLRNDLSFNHCECVF